MKDEEKKITLLERDVLGTKDSKGNSFELGRGFRKKDLSEKDLVKREKTPEKQEQLEDRWSQIEEHKYLKTRLGKASIVALSLIIIAGIWAFIPQGDSKSTESAEQRAQAIKQQIADASKAAELEALKENNIKLCVKNYLEADNFQERAKWCRSPDTTLEKMMIHQRRGKEVEKYNYTGELQYNEIFLSGGIPVVIVSANNRTNPEADESEIEIITLILEAQPDLSFAVDWETDAIYQPDDWDQFIDSKSSEAHTFRVEVTDCNNLGPYLFNYSDDQVYQAYRVSIKGKPNSYLLAYAKKNSEIDSKLKHALKIDTSEKIRTVSKRTATMTLALSFPKDAYSDQCVEIKEIISDSWYQP